jgi:putative transposase
MMATLARLHGQLRAQVRTAAGRQPQPTAAVIDSQSVRAADTVPRASRGWDNAKKVNGRKRHIAVDTTGLVLDVVITPASVQDRQGARPLLWNTHRACRGVRLVWADAGYSGKLAAWAETLKMTLQIVAKRDRHAFEVLPRRWVVERTFAWISKHRRTVRDYEHLPASHEAMILWAMIALMTRRLAQPIHLSDTHLACRLTSAACPDWDRRSCPVCRRDVVRPPHDDLRVPTTELEDTGGGRGVQHGMGAGRSRGRRPG